MMRSTLVWNRVASASIESWALTWYIGPACEREAESKKIDVMNVIVCLAYTHAFSVCMHTHSHTHTHIHDRCVRASNPSAYPYLSLHIDRYTQTQAFSPNDNRVRGGKYAGLIG